MSGTQHLRLLKGTKVYLIFKCIQNVEISDFISLLFEFIACLDGDHECTGCFSCGGGGV